MTPCLLILLHELWSSCIIWSTVKRWISIFRGREIYGHPNLVTFPQGQKFHVGTNVKLFLLQPGTFFSSVMTGSSSSILAGRDGWKIATLLLKCYGCGFMLMCVSAASLTSHIWVSPSNTWSTVRLPLISVKGPRVIKDRCILLVIDISTFYKHSALVIKYFFVIWKFILGEKGV